MCEWVCVQFRECVIFSVRVCVCSVCSVCVCSVCEWVYVFSVWVSVCVQCVSECMCSVCEWVYVFSVWVSVCVSVCVCSVCESVCVFSVWVSVCVQCVSECMCSVCEWVYVFSQTGDTHTHHTLKYTHSHTVMYTHSTHWTHTLHSHTAHYSHSHTLNTEHTHSIHSLTHWTHTLTHTLNTYTHSHTEHIHIGHTLNTATHWLSQWTHYHTIIQYVRTHTVPALTEGEGQLSWRDNLSADCVHCRFLLCISIGSTKMQRKSVELTSFKRTIKPLHFTTTSSARQLKLSLRYYGEILLWFEELSKRSAVRELLSLVGRTINKIFSHKSGLLRPWLVLEMVIVLMACQSLMDRHDCIQ